MPYRPEYETNTATLERPELSKPSMYKVILLNDDFTPMEFVVEILMAIFAKNQQQAIEIMLKIHHKGSAVAGIYSFEIAETKVNQVIAAARHSDYPLQCTLEKD